MIYEHFTGVGTVELQELIMSLYSEDPNGENISEEKINKTITFLAGHPDNGMIVTFPVDGIIAGYSILIHYWSNELGGMVVSIDELYVRPSHRNKGIASKFIEQLIRTKYNDCVAISLEVTVANTRALALYKKIGFVPFDTIWLKYRLI